MNPLDINKEQECIVKIDGLAKLHEGEYETGVYLNIKGINLDKIIKIKIKIIINEIEVEEHLDKIKQFRETFNISEEDYSNKDLYYYLSCNDFNFEDALVHMFEG